MIILTKDNAATPVPYSAGDGSDPVSVSFSLDGTSIPETITKSPLSELHIWANNHTGTIGSYTGIKAEITGSDAGIVWELSLDGETGWAAFVDLADLTVSATFQAVRIFARATAINDGSLVTDNFVAAKVAITATERPL